MVLSEAVSSTALSSCEEKPCFNSRSSAIPEYADRTPGAIIIDSRINIVAEVTNFHQHH